MRGQFMIGNPGETLETAKESIEFARTSDLTSSQFSMAVPFPRTPLWDYAADEGHYLVEKDVTFFDDVLGKIIFETDDFSRFERIEARELARKHGFFYQRFENKSLKKRVRQLATGVWNRHLYHRLPRRISWRVNALLRRIDKGAAVHHDVSEWGRARHVEPEAVRMKGLSRKPAADKRAVAAS